MFYGTDNIFTDFVLVFLTFRLDVRNNLEIFCEIWSVRWNAVMDLNNVMICLSSSRDTTCNPSV